MKMIDTLIQFPEFHSDISFEPVSGQELKEWVQDNYTDEEMEYLVQVYASNINFDDIEIELNHYTYSDNEVRNYLNPYDRQVEDKESEIQMVTIEYSDKRLTAVNEEAKKWKRHVEAMGTYCTIHNMNPFDKDNVNWNITNKL